MEIFILRIILAAGDNLSIESKNSGKAIAGVQRAFAAIE
jgi:hypothetical protein